MIVSHQLRISPLDFIGENEEIVQVLKPVIFCDGIENYYKWLTTLVERVNEALHPALQGKKIRAYSQYINDNERITF